METDTQGENSKLAVATEQPANKEAPSETSSNPPVVKSERTNSVLPAVASVPETASKAGESPPGPINSGGKKVEMAETKSTTLPIPTTGPPTVLPTEVSGEAVPRSQTETTAKTSSISEARTPDELLEEKSGQWAAGDDGVLACPSLTSGLDHLRTPQLYKGMGFSLIERQQLGIHGFLPPRIKTQEEQIALCMLNVQQSADDLSKYRYLMALQDSNEKLFYQLLSENVQKLLPLVYTPTVGLACQNYGLIYMRPRGLFITVHDKGHVYEILKNWPEPAVRAIVVTDGERILGLGDLGAQGMGIPVGKMALYTALAGIKPHHCLPITLDVGTNRETLLADPLYIGLKQKRIRGNQYDDFVEEFMQAVVKRFGQTTLIQFEDFGKNNAFRLLEKYRDRYCTFNDDIQGTAAVVVAGLLASLRITKTRLSDNILLFQGAGQASLGIAGLLVMAMEEEGTPLKDARDKIWMVDSQGLIVTDRLVLTTQKALYAKKHKPIKNLEEIVMAVRPTVLIGAAAVGGVFTPKLLRSLTEITKRPIVFALSNPTEKAECTAEEAYINTDGKAIFASGSPFDPVTYEGKTFYPGQANNSYIFPGIALGVISVGILKINNDMFLAAAKALANFVSEADLDNGSLYPPLQNIRACSLNIAIKVAEVGYKKEVASTIPQPKNIETFIKAQLYDSKYRSSVPDIYPWPKTEVTIPKLKKEI